MAVTSPGGRSKEGFPSSCSIGTSVLLKLLLRGEVNSFCSNDHVHLHKYPSHALDQMGALDAMEEVGPSSLSRHISNGTSTMDIDVDDIYFDDSDSDDETESYLPKVSTESLE
ncbi:hypothetical protein Fot_14500 [Forsythia ovata]|uniref:Uncharacterized protein n=1 Tax=Forsythia ovata TaxID=205694 RepID=A0ABD1W6T5_9LAMI